MKESDDCRGQYIGSLMSHPATITSPPNDPRPTKSSSTSPTTRCRTSVDSEAAYETAYYCLMDTLACGFQALQYPACTKLMGPVVPGATHAGRRARARHFL